MKTLKSINQSHKQNPTSVESEITLQLIEDRIPKSLDDDSY